LLVSQSNEKEFVSTKLVSLHFKKAPLSRWILVIFILSKTIVKGTKFFKHCLLTSMEVIKIDYLQLHSDPTTSYHTLRIC